MLTQLLSGWALLPAYQPIIPRFSFPDLFSIVKFARVSASTEVLGLAHYMLDQCDPLSDGVLLHVFTKKKKRKESLFNDPQGENKSILLSFPQTPAGLEHKALHMVMHTNKSKHWDLESSPRSLLIDSALTSFAIYN